MRVLAVDDDPQALRYVRDALASAGYTPVVTGDPEEALRLVAGAGGTVALSRAVISSLVSLSLGLDRPSSEFLLVMFPLVSVSLVCFAQSAVASMFPYPPSGRSAPSFRDPQELGDLPPRRSGVLHPPRHWKQSKMPKVGTSKAAELGDRAEEGG